MHRREAIGLLCGRLRARLTVCFVGGYAIGYLTGNVTAEGFNLQGTPALILLAVIIFTS